MDTIWTHFRVSGQFSGVVIRNRLQTPDRKKISAQILYCEIGYISSERVNSFDTQENRNDSLSAPIDDLFYRPTPQNPLLRISFFSERILLLNKPAGLVTHPTKGDQYSSVISRVKLLLESQSLVPEALHLINRLDRETSGLIVFAFDNELAKKIRKAWETGQVRKTYLALVHGHPNWSSITCTGALGNDEASPIHIRDTVRPDGKPSVTTFKVLQKFAQPDSGYSLIEAKPVTGRKHQIRIHLNHLGHPIVGDKIYGLDPMTYLRFISGSISENDRRQMIFPWHALHAASLEFPSGLLPMKHVECGPEDWFTEFCRINAWPDMM